MEISDAIEFSIQAATLLDIAHPKKDCNGRSSEDFMVWIQSQLISNPEDYFFLSDSGLRTRGLNSMFPEKQGQYETLLSEEEGNRVFDMRNRIDDRGELVVLQRRAMYDQLASKIGISVGELESKMSGFTYSKDVREERKSIRQEATSIFKERIDSLGAEQIGLRRNQYQKLYEYYYKSGVNRYNYLRPEEVFQGTK